MANEFGINLSDAISELQSGIEDAHSYMAEFSDDWETGEAYYAGKCDLPVEQGRSTVVKTEARDVIRAVMPNVMRVLLQSNKPVEYIPNRYEDGPFSDQQGRWINQMFMASGGYDVLFSAALESMKLKSGPVKVFWNEDAHPEHIYATGLSREEVLAYGEAEDVIIDKVEQEESPTGGVTYEIYGTRYYPTGKMEFEAFPIYEFFTTRNASDLSGLHGHRRTVTVSEALEMGLEYDTWRELDDNDPRTNDQSGVEQHRRGKNPSDNKEQQEGDLLNHKFLLTEAYCEYDMDGDGVPEKYVFYFGGTSYQYLHHEEVEDFCIALVSIDPQPFTVIGRSLVDITKQSQDNETSILRAIVDNAHQANNPRPAADPRVVDFRDLMNNAIGAPIRTKGDARIQYADIPFTAGGLLPFMQWLEQDAENRVGVTKAARGLDPDALQSTDKEAVQNTIHLSQGQIELMVRNIVNTGLIPLFRMALRIATRHMSRSQVMFYKGNYVPVNTALFDPNLAARPNVGIGTASAETKLQTLSFVYGEQKAYMERFGLDNPFTSLSQVYNTLEDIMELGGLHNASRYFNHVGKVEEEVIGRNMAMAAAKQAEQAQRNQPMDPAKALVITEAQKARIRQLEIMTDRATKSEELQQRALEKAEELDFKRDDMAQDRIIRLMELGQGAAANERIKREQDATSATPPKPTGPSGLGATGTE